MRTNRFLTQKSEILNFGIVDVLRNIDPSKNFKYLNMLTKHVQNKINKQFGGEQIDYIKKDYLQKRGLEHLVQNMDNTSIGLFVNILENFFSEDDIKLLHKFEQLTERGLIKNCDVNQYNSLDELAQIVSMAEIKLNEKELQKLVVRVYEDDNWLLIRPLTHLAAVKYGYGTKWCTSMLNNYEHFERYTYRGVLIYCINIKTGEKVAFFHNIKPEWGEETSFWDVKDSRIDSLTSGLPFNVLISIKQLLDDVNTKTNMELMSLELKKQELEYYNSFYEKHKLDYNDVEEIGIHPVPEDGPAIPNETSNYLASTMNI